MITTSRKEARTTYVITLTLTAEEVQELYTALNLGPVSFFASSQLPGEIRRALVQVGATVSLEHRSPK